MSKDTDILNNLKNLQSQVNFFNQKTKEYDKNQVSMTPVETSPIDFNLDMLSFQNIKVGFFIIYPILTFCFLYFYQPSFVLCEEKIPGTFFVSKKLDLSLVFAYTIGSYLFICLFYFIYISKVEHQPRK